MLKNFAANYQSNNAMPSPHLMWSLFVIMIIVLCIVNHVWLEPVILALRRGSLDSWSGAQPTCGKVPIRIKELSYPSYIDFTGSSREVYYDVSFPPRCVPKDGFSLLDWLEYQQTRIWDFDTVVKDVVLHWQQTLPDGVQAVYPESNPQVFIQLTGTNPWYIWARDGYLHDSGSQSLWVQPVTEQKFHINPEIVHTVNPMDYRFLVFYKLAEPIRDNVGMVKRQMGWGTLPKAWSHEKKIIVHLPPDGGRHPDAYIFTEAAQKEMKLKNASLTVARVYELLFPPGVYPK